MAVCVALLAAPPSRQYPPSFCAIEEAVPPAIGHAARPPDEGQNERFIESGNVRIASRPDSKGRQEPAFRIDQVSSGTGEQVRRG